MRRRSKKYLCFIAFILFITSYISSSFIFAYFRDVYFQELSHYVTDLIPDDIACYKENSRYTFINESIYVPNSIFFYQTNCENTLSLRRACSVEAASTFHQNRNIYVLFGNMPERTNVVNKEILKLPNVYITKVNVYKYAENTPFHRFLTDLIKKEIRRYKATADFLKLITLYKCGGIVLDFDVILAKSLENLGDNWVVRDEDAFSMSALKMSYGIIGQAISGMILRSLKNQAEHGFFNVGKAIADTFDELYIITNKNNITARNCNGLKIHDNNIFQPISFSDRYLYFKPGDLQNTVHGYHTWDDGIRKIFPGKSLYAKLARTYCPRIFSTFMHDFVTDY